MSVQMTGQPKGRSLLVVFRFKIEIDSLAVMFNRAYFFKNSVGFIQIENSLTLQFHRYFSDSLIF